MTRAALAAALALYAVVGWRAGTARADAPFERPTGFEADREAPPPGRAEFSFDGGTPVPSWALAAQLGYLNRPFSLRSTLVEVYPVDHRETLAIGVALPLGPAVVVDARMPLSLQSGPRLQGVGDTRPLDSWVRGDLAVGVRLRVAHRERYAAFVRGQLTLGTGDDFDFAGEINFTASWLLIGRFMPIDRLIVAGTTGVRFRGAEVIVADRLLGDELVGGIGASYQLPAIRGLYCDANDVRLVAEVVGALGNDVAGRRGPSPLEGKLGLATRIRPWWAIAARIGTGLDDQIGAARFRALVELVYIGGAR